MKYVLFLILLGGLCINHVQAGTLRGRLVGNHAEPLVFANVALYKASDSTLYKVEPTDENGQFTIAQVEAGLYYLSAAFLGYADFYYSPIEIDADEEVALGDLTLIPSSVELEEMTVTAQRRMVEVKADRMVFNVQGTVNSAGGDAMSLLRKAPSVTVDNNDNINVLGRSGVLVYVDGRRLPLAGQELTNYLQTLTAEQIDRIDIITNPGAKYEAEGNAGIIDIRLKKNETYGANGNANLSYSQGLRYRGNVGLGGNYRNKHANIFGNVGYGKSVNLQEMLFENIQNNLHLDETMNIENSNDDYNYKLGADFFIGTKHTIGILTDGGFSAHTEDSYNRIVIARLATPTAPDSILVANTTADNDRSRQSYNLNYRLDTKKGTTLNIDLDHANYQNKTVRFQPNIYYSPDEKNILSQVNNEFSTPSDIAISSAKADVEQSLWGGQLGFGSKVSWVMTDNSFLVYDYINQQPVQNNYRSNIFKYNEKVYAGYINYARSIGQKWQLSAGLRAEQTDAEGNLEAFIPDLQEPPVKLNYLSWFPSAGISWQAAPKHSFALNYGRRINRPDYNVLNPFNNQLSQISYEKGNPFLSPEIVNNLELNYTLAYQYNLKLAYSNTQNQITRLMAPDQTDPRSNFITWDNLATQKTYSANLSIPTQITKNWSAFFNITAAYLDNQADYGNGAIVDLQTFNYVIFQQQTITLPKGFKGEISGYYSGPGIWGGVFKYKPNWGLDLGLQRRFLQDRLNVRLSVSDIFYKMGWRGTSNFNGLIMNGQGNWDSRRVSLNLGYNFGNDKIKSRRRDTGIQDEQNRIKTQ